MRKIRIKRSRPPSYIPQASVVKNQFQTSPLSATWGKVEKAHSKDNTVDVLLASGISLKHVDVRSLEWAGANSSRGYGERDLPPEDSIVLVLFIDGIIDSAFVLCSALTVLGDPSEKQKAELLVSGKEREKLRISEAGWKETYDKDTGDLTLENLDNPQMTVKLDRSGNKIEAQIGNEKLVVGSENKLTANGATIEITGAGGINVSPFAGQSVTLASGVQTCNNLPACLLSGAPHWTNPFVKV